MVPEFTNNRELDVRKREVEEVVGDEREGDDKRLRDLNPIDAGKDIDAVGRERREKRHIDVVKRAWQTKPEGSKESKQERQRVMTDAVRARTNRDGRPCQRASGSPWA